MATGSFENFSLAVATPSYSGSICAEYLVSMLALQKQCIERQIEFTHLMVSNISVIDIARNRLTSQFFHETTASHMLFVDDDMGFGIPEFFRMLEYGHQADVVAAMCPRKSIDWARIKDIVLAKPDIDPLILPAVAGDYQQMFRFEQESTTLTVGPTPVPVAAIGTGIMLISRRCLQRLIDAGLAPGSMREHGDAHGVKSQGMYHEFFRSSSSNGELIGEDYYFCSQVRAAGGTVLGCSWIPVTHTGRYTFRGDLPGIATYLA